MKPNKLLLLVPTVASLAWAQQSDAPTLSALYAPEASRKLTAIYEAEPSGWGVHEFNGESGEFDLLYERLPRTPETSATPTTPAAQSSASAQGLPRVTIPPVQAQRNAVPTVYPFDNAAPINAGAAVETKRPAKELPSLANLPARPGSLVKARLRTAAVVPAGTPVPVLVQAEPTWCGEEACEDLKFLGDAQIMVGGRVEVVLSYAVLGGETYQVRAVAFDANDTGYGITAKVVEAAPSIAADLVRGTLGGISDWVNAASQAQSSTVLANGAVAVTKETPPLSSFLASRAASLFSLPQNSKALTRVMVAEAGTPVLVLVQPTPNRANK